MQSVPRQSFSDILLARNPDRPEPAPNAPIGEGVLQVYDVLEEEYGYLAGHEAPAPSSRDWSVRPQHILDLADCARKLCVAREAVHAGGGRRTTAAFDATRDVSRALLGLTGPEVGDNGAALRAALDDYTAASQPAHPLEAALTEQLAGRMNLLIHEAGLVRQEGFATLQADTFTEDLREQEREKPAGRHREVNRLLFEAAFPSQLIKVRDIHLQQLYQGAHGAGHAALCLSGGGIRSATFSLGVVQGLARLGLLGRFRYLSTVSGGGYLGGWLSAWMMRSGAAHVIDALSGAPTEKLEPEPEPIRHPRAFSNFLSPRLGALSADTWSLIATYLRNLWVNWLVSIPLLLSLVIVPYGAVAVVESMPEDWAPLNEWVLPIGMTVLGMALAIVAVYFVHSRRPCPRAENSVDGMDDASTSHIRSTQEQFLAQCLLPLVLATVFLSAAWRLLLGWNLVDDASNVPIVGFVVVAVAIHAIGWLWAGFATAFQSARRPLERAGEAVGILVTGVLAGLATHFAAHRFALEVPDSTYVVFAMPAFLALILLGSQFFLALTSSRSRDSEREWGARFNGWVLIVMASWTAFAWLVLRAPELLERYAPTFGTRGLALVGGWSGLTTILLGRSASTSSGARKAQPTLGDRVRAMLLSLAAPVFAATIVVLLSMLDARLIGASCDILPEKCRIIADTPRVALWHTVALLGALLFLFGVLFGRLIDTNRFSLHAMYRARLLRAYLGASRPPSERNPDPFTGFDELDNLRMQELWPVAAPADSRIAPPDAPRPPLHVVNVALNLTGGRNLAWQERKAESFTMSPLHAGSAFTGYRRTSPIKGIDVKPTDQRLYGGKDGVSLGTAMTISGAAANPNMGYHSSPAVTFLLTLFNARLGWWLGNSGPAGRHTFDRPAPGLTAWQLMKELFGFTNDRSPYVQLSDGGHFDNLGLYEMVLRRCRHIVVVDASCDPDRRYDDLGNAIRKIRIDLGVPIEFDPSVVEAVRSIDAPADCYAAVGRIRYSCVDSPPDADAEVADQLDGTMVYIKPAMLGNEPRDVYTYQQQHPAFPHEATLDQFYSESQFESYRALGSHIMDTFRAPGGSSSPGWGTIEAFVEQVRKAKPVRRHGVPT